MYGLGDTDMIAKYIRPKISEGDLFFQMKSTYAMYKHYFGSQATDTWFVKTESNVAETTDTYYAIQPRIQGADLFSNIDTADMSELRLFTDNVVRFIEETNCIPDISGKGNVLTDIDGRIHIVDVLHAWPVTMAPREALLMVDNCISMSELHHPVAITQ